MSIEWVEFRAKVMHTSSMSPNPTHDLPEADWKQQLRRRLKQWYKQHARDLPWRRTRDPYRIWISEIMLQQTQVATVVPYYERFLNVFPTVHDLAQAKEERVLKRWEGLGYYRRARQLHRAAKQIVDEHGGVFPDSVESVDALPGIGRYTRGAILSFAFNQRQPILEANTIRLNSRLLAFEGDTRSKQGQTLLWSFAEAILPQKDVGLFNQALMELGSAICMPKSPKCLLCPLASLCPTRARGLQDSIPRSPKKVAYEDIMETAVVVFKKNQVLLRRCKDGERWAGLWDFPRFATPKNASSCHERDEVKRMTGIECDIERELATIKHGVTKYRITLQCRSGRYVAGRLRTGGELAWVRTSSLPDYPLSSTGRKIANLLNNH